jgi:hypothetical protein
MKLSKLFTAAATTAALSLSLAFSANAELITQSFDIEFDGGSATIEIAADTDNADPFFEDVYLWDNDAIEYFSFSDLTLPNSDDTLDAFFSGDDIPLSFALFSAVAYLDSVSGDGIENGFKEIVFEIDLGAINEMLFGFAQVAVFNDDIEIGGFFVGFEEQAGDFDGALMVTPGTVQVGTVQVSAPTTALFVLLSIGGMFVARRK